MRSRDADILIVPGLGGSGPDHWQSRWQSKLPTARRVEQADWDHPMRATWVSRMAEAIAGTTRPVVVIAHSLGVITAAHALADCDPDRIAGAFLVAPPDEDALRAIPEIDADFLPYPRGPLPCPSILVGSTNDPYASPATTEGYGLDWGSRYVDAGAAGHINTASGHGPWPEGLMTFAGFLSKLMEAGRGG